MKGLKVKEIWQMSSEDRQKKLKELRDDLMHERGTGAMGGALKSPGRVKAIRKTIAQILTIEAQAKRLEEKAKKPQRVSKTEKEENKDKSSDKPHEGHQAHKESSIKKKEEKKDGRDL